MERRELMCQTERESRSGTLTFLENWNQERRRKKKGTVPSPPPAISFSSSFRFEWTRLSSRCRALARLGHRQDNFSSVQAMRGVVAGFTGNKCNLKARFPLLSAWELNRPHAACGFINTPRELNAGHREFHCVDHPFIHLLFC